MNEFELHLLSTASLNIFMDNTLASFKNQLPQNVSLEGDWCVALSEIIFPSRIHNVTTKFLYLVSKVEQPKKRNTQDDPLEDNQSPKENVIQVYNKCKLVPGEYETITDLVDHLRNVSDSSISVQQTRDMENADKIGLRFPAYTGWTFPDRNIPNLLGFQGEETAIGIHIGNERFENDRLIEADYPTDLISGINLMFVYTDLIEYQNTGDVKAPILRIIDSGKRVQNSKLLKPQNLERRSFVDLQYKKLLTQNFQTISIQLRTETGSLVPFFGTGQVVLTLKFKKFS